MWNGQSPPQLRLRDTIYHLRLTIPQPGGLSDVLQKSMLSRTLQRLSGNRLEFVFVANGCPCVDYVDVVGHD